MNTVKMLERVVGEFKCKIPDSRATCHFRHIGSEPSRASPKPGDLPLNFQQLVSGNPFFDLLQSGMNSLRADPCKGEDDLPGGLRSERKSPRRHMQ